MGEFSVHETTGNSGERFQKMQALIDSHIFVTQIQPRDLFRSAYLKKFGKDMPEHSLEEDVKKYMETGKTPGYMIDFMVDTYGAQ